MADYKWNYSCVGGVTRVSVTSGADIAHLCELDKKKWTVISCPVKGLEIPEDSLRYMDTNNDGAIHVDEVVAVANWLTKVLKNHDIILEGKDSLSLDALNTDDADGKALYDTILQVLKTLGKEDAKEIALADSSACLASIKKEKFEAALAAIDKSAAVEAPFGDKTDAIEAAYNALDAKVKDFFMRGKLAGFAKESTAALDVQVGRIEAISAENLTARMDEIASYPIARIDGSETLSLSVAINPAWAAQFETVKAALPADAKELTEAAWGEIGAKIKAYRDYQASVTITEDSITIDDETAAVMNVDKLLHLTRDFYTLLKNYVTFQDFYAPGEKAIFQAGTLLIDQRMCDLCLRVADAGAQAAQAPKSGMYLITCDCSSKVWNESFKIMAAMTVGDVDDLFVGKNCIFYDRKGRDFDAKVTAIIENPISIRQAMWTPYKKMANFISEQINKFASEKEAGVMSDATATITEKTEAAKSADSADAGKQVGSFDIAKYAGIFAAVGMALGMIGTALVAVGKGIMGLTWWQFPLIILAIMLVISGPSMFIAWLKLRKRNIAPVLNANGWAINASAKINIPFGATLTNQAKYPKGIKIKDPYPQKSPVWVKLLCWLVVLGFVVYGAYRLNQKYQWIECPCCCGEQCEAPAETPADAVETEAPVAEESQAPVEEAPVVEEGSAEA
ncbi:MAG: hypothetical protein KBT20_02370 [Bacteroidales bacterium]|nr:hypothetical protein [Candidatus Liminaster caballi]